LSKACSCWQTERCEGRANLQFQPFRPRIDCRVIVVCRVSIVVQKTRAGSKDLIPLVACDSSPALNPLIIIPNGWSLAAATGNRTIANNRLVHDWNQYSVSSQPFGHPTGI